MRPGFRKVLAQRLFELEHTTRDDVTQLYNDQERAAFERGYRAAVQDVLVLVGAGLAGAAFLTVCLSPALYQKVREKVRPWVVRQVELGRPWVIWIQRFRHPLLDRVHLLAANSCGILFYITALPFLFWAGELQLARQLTSFMATCIYVGNAVKDAISAPRPDWKKGVRLVSDGASDGSSTDDMEYGLPSTHTINTVCMWLYIFYFYASSTSHGDGISVYWNTWRPQKAPKSQTASCLCCRGRFHRCMDDGDNRVRPSISIGLCSGPLLDISTRLAADSFVQLRRLLHRCLLGSCHRRVALPASS